MLIQTKNNYRSVADHFDIKKSSDYNKQLIIQMAKSGQRRPKDKEKIGKCFYSYTKKGSSSYDHKFHKTIKKLRPDWFIKTIDHKKKKLLEMARRKEKRPAQATELGRALCTYVNKSSKIYDKKFADRMYEMRPDWFIPTNVDRKNKLLKMAKDGSKRPNQKTNLGSSLCSYTNNSASAFDLEFNLKIRKMRPDWFIDRAKQSKQELIKIAKSGGKKPKFNTRLGFAFTTHTSKRDGDPKFIKLIKRLRPDWFVTQKERVEQKKKELLKMAKEGKQRPNKKTKLGSALKNYTAKSSQVYDKKFFTAIKRIRPEWFKKEIANQRKEQLLKIAKCGKEKPNFLKNYIYKSSSGYDAAFTKLIKRTRPDWFSCHPVEIRHSRL